MKRYVVDPLSAKGKAALRRAGWVSHYAEAGYEKGMTPPKGNKMKTSIFIFIAVALSFVGCVKDARTGKWTLNPATKAQLATSASALGKDALAIARQTVDRFATSELDALAKNGFTQSSGDLLRSLENSALASATSQIEPTIQRELAAWLPDKSHWQNYSTQIAQLIDGYVKTHPNDPNAANVALEAVATYLNTKPAASTHTAQNGP